MTAPPGDIWERITREPRLVLKSPRGITLRETCRVCDATGAPVLLVRVPFWSFWSNRREVLDAETRRTALIMRPRKLAFLSPLIYDVTDPGDQPVGAVSTADSINDGLAILDAENTRLAEVEAELDGSGVVSRLRRCRVLRPRRWRVMAAGQVVAEIERHAFAYHMNRFAAPHGVVDERLLIAAAILLVTLGGKRNSASGGPVVGM